MVKNLHAKVEAGLILGLERSPGEGNGKPLQYSCLGNPMDRISNCGRPQFMESQKSDTTEQLNNNNNNNKNRIPPFLSF